MPVKGFQTITVKDKTIEEVDDILNTNNRFKNRSQVVTKAVSNLKKRYIKNDD
jgi:metal-responsive CopG/Arc/MetJ family transcriptional regulator